MRLCLLRHIAAGCGHQRGLHSRGSHAYKKTASKAGESIAEFICSVLGSERNQGRIGRLPVRIRKIQGRWRVKPHHPFRITANV
ncbi:hypothetical protein N656DRAFT_389636 [Canariomyces notabilis]|uniref:Uncharacterized protein n=1 Tax=Canariomyces notabilis TaxID=2074819 RepID=A0AAN6YW23_9PEZI|nr:hypothetical protein N656DRAFT_389636 [Canariomyces arenarius]